jgi:hypothetical protein
MQVKEVVCCYEGCGYSPFPMEEGFFDRAKRTHEFWTCPAGHRQHFASETLEERRIRELRAEVERVTELAQSYRKQLAHPWCPWVGCEFQAASLTGLQTHLRARHGMPTLAAVSEVA